MYADRLTGLMQELRAVHACPRPSKPSLVLPARVRAILVEVGAKHGFMVEDLQGESRKDAVVLARQEAMYRLWTECRWMSYAAVAKALCRDHSTAIYGVKQYAKRMGLPVKREKTNAGSSPGAIA